MKTLSTDMTAKDAQKKLSTLASPDVATSSAWFFKSGPGQYGEGDRFIGVRVPTLRAVAREFRGLPLAEIAKILKSPIHEERLLALLILVLQTAKSNHVQRKATYDCYLKHTKFINNWDLVDSSAPQIVGGYLIDKSRQPLFDLARSNSLWERRIAIVSTLSFIRQGDFAETLAISQSLLNDPEDLIHKAAGWMLREVGKRDRPILAAFLDRHGPAMPRTMLRYAIENFPPDRRRIYLAAKTRGDQPG
jgi:3-methyladenine DNA glycosylase AlkD